MARTIIFIHGLWLHGSSWEPWMKFFSLNNYNVMNPPWPGDGATVEESRSNPNSIANHGVTEVCNSYAKVISTMPEPPILIGHSFGGLIVQVLLGRGIAAAGIAIDPAPMKGVWQLPLSALKASFPVLGNPFNLKRAVSLTFKQFRYAFTNAVPEQEAKELFDQCTIPAPGRPLFQVATATLNPNSETTVNVANSTRGPLLITSGEKDHIVPPILAGAAFKKYRHSPAVTQFRSFPNRGHSLVIDSGWKEIAEYSLMWLNQNGL